MLLLLSLVLIFAIIYYLWSPEIENYKQCRGCDDDIRMLDGGMTVYNPYVWPYSGTEHPDSLYQLPATEQVCYGFKNSPMTHSNTPDHVILM